MPPAHPTRPRAPAGSGRGADGVLLALPDELHRRQAREALAKFWLIELSGFDLAEKTAVNYHTLRARGIDVNPAECRLATFCIDQGFALLHSSAGYEPFGKHLELPVVRG